MKLVLLYFGIKMLENRLCLEKEMIYGKIIEDVKCSMGTLPVIYRYESWITLALADVVYLYML